MYKYIKDYDKENHEMRYIVNQYGVDVIVSKDILIDDQNKEIERLNKKIEEIQKINLADHKYASEMEDKYITTNNIINEMEKYLEERVSKSVLKGCSFEQTYITGKWDAYKNSLNKLQSLKGDSSNE